MSPDELQRDQSVAALPRTSLHPTTELVSSVGIPHVSFHAGNLVLGDSTTSSHRSFSIIKNLGEGSFGSVFLCDWHSKLPHDAPPPSTTHGPSPGTHLVAVKKLKRKLEQGWDACKSLKELKALCALSPHPCIIPLYDVFLSTESSELHFVFEAMEGNLYQFMKARKGRALDICVLSSVFEQLSGGLNHIHSSGYFHRDMKPENILFATPELHPEGLGSGQNDVNAVVICKIADFDCTREITSTPPYTEHVSARWYRAPEVLLKQRDYSAPVDMWALGTIMAELVNLKPIFPGSGEIDQINRIINVLGDPADRGVDARGRVLGGGPWVLGLELAGRLACRFPKVGFICVCVCVCFWGVF